MQALAVVGTVSGAAQAEPLTLAACERVTHPSHGGEALHRDLGQGRVAWVEWWSQEGSYADLHVADCGTGQELVARAQEERISDRLAFDRREAVRAIFERHASASPAFFRLDALAHDLRNVAEDIRITPMTQDPCACAAAYPELRGARPEFGGLE